MNELINQKPKDLEIVKQRKKSEVPIYFTEQELLKFFMAIPQENIRDKVFFLTLLGTGRRISEILGDNKNFYGIKKSDIDFTNKTIRIRTLKRRKLQIDTIRLPQDVAYWLSIYTGSMKAEDKVFNFTRQSADRLTKHYAKKAGLTYKRTSPHIFRHTFAIRFLEQGLPIHKLKRHLGHKHILSTMVYLQIVDKDYNETIDKLNILSFLNHSIK